MKRIPEPDLMVNSASVAAYAEADFGEPHSRFVAEMRNRLAFLAETGCAADLGCGVCDVSLRLAEALPLWRIDAVDGSLPMLVAASAALAQSGLSRRIELHSLTLPCNPPRPGGYDLVFSNSLLHHLANPATLWDSLRSWTIPGGGVFVMDLSRPATADHARALVDRHARRESETLRTDFYNSLLAAYEPHEVRAQLAAAGLGSLDFETISDRHWIVWGRNPVSDG